MSQMTSKGRPEILQAGRGTWIPINTLEEYTLDTELIIDITMTARQKQIARERFTMIAPLLAFLTDDKERNRIMTRIAEERAMLTSNGPRVKEIDERLEALQQELLRGRLFLSAW